MSRSSLLAELWELEDSGIKVSPCNIKQARNIKRSRKIIFCDAYGQVIVTLFLLTKFYVEYDTWLVICGSKSLNRLFTEMNEKKFDNRVKIVFIADYQAYYRSKGHPLFLKALHVPSDIIRERAYLRQVYAKHFIDCQDDEVYFAIPLAFNGLKIWLVKELAKSNRMIALNFENYQKKVEINNAKELKAIMAR